MGARYRTGSGSERMPQLNCVLRVSSPGEIVNRTLKVASGRYRSRFCNNGIYANGLPESRNRSKLHHD
jgi:hypothetical protein